MITLTTPAGRGLQVEVEADLALGRVYYRVQGVGTFTIETDPGRDDEPDNPYLHVVYGRWTSPWVPSYEILPETPVVFAIRNITGAWVFTTAPPADDRTRRWHGKAVVRRLTSSCTAEPAPDGTCRRIGDIVLALAADFEARDDRHSLDLARLRRLAVGRHADLVREMARLDERIAALEEERRLTRARALIQAAYLAPVDAS